MSDTEPCSYCGLSINEKTCVYVTFPLCNHRIHERCRDMQRFAHHLSACPACERTEDKLPELDLGDDSVYCRISKLLLFKEHNEEILQNGPYKPSEIRMQCQEMLQNLKYKRTEGRQSADKSSWFGNIFRQESSNQETSRRVAKKTYNPHEMLREKAMVFATQKHDIIEFQENDINVTTLYDAGITVKTMMETGYTLEDLYLLGFTWEHMVVMELKWDDLSYETTFPPMELRKFFGVTYKTIIDMASMKGPKALGVERFCSLFFTYEEMLELEMTDLQFLVDLGLNYNGFVNLRRTLNFDDMMDLKLNVSILRKVDCFTIDKWKKLKFGEPEEIARRLKIETSDVPSKKAPPPMIKKPADIPRDEGSVVVDSPAVSSLPAPTPEYKEEDSDVAYFLQKGNWSNLSAHAKYGY